MTDARPAFCIAIREVRRNVEQCVPGADSLPGGGARRGAGEQHDEGADTQTFQKALLLPVCTDGEAFCQRRRCHVGEDV